MHDPNDCEGLKRLEGKIDEMIEAQKEFLGAFAKDLDNSPDLIGHRAYHEEVIAAVKAQTAFWRDLRYDLTKKGIWGIILVVLGLAVTGLVYKLMLLASKMGLAVPVK
jgi:hypothetical protein